jgi:hypothetical protein
MFPGTRNDSQCRVALNGENEEVAPGAGVAGLSATVHCT